MLAYVVASVLYLVIGVLLAVANLKLAVRQGWNYDDDHNWIVVLAWPAMLLIGALVLLCIAISDLVNWLAGNR